MLYPNTSDWYTEGLHRIGLLMTFKLDRMWHSNRNPHLSLEISNWYCAALCKVSLLCHYSTSSSSKIPLSLRLCLRLPLLLDLLLLTYPSVLFQFIPVLFNWHSRTSLEQLLISSPLTHDLFFIFWRSSGASNLSALPKISPSSLTNNHNSSFNSRK